MTAFPSWLVPGQEPRRDKADPALFDRTSFTKPSRRYRLLSRSCPTTRRTRIWCRDHGVPSLSGIAERARSSCGNGVERVIGPWNPEGLFRIRGVLLASTRPAENGGRDLVWTDRPQTWAAKEPDPGPYVLRTAAELALNGADVSDSNIPGAAELAARTVEANRLARDDVQSLGPRLGDRDGFGRDVPLPWTVKAAQELYRLELADAQRKKDAARSRVRTSEYRNEQTGEYGAEAKMTRDGRVWFGKKDLPMVSRRHVGVRGIASYTTRRNVNGRRVEAQKSPNRRRPGPKPQNGLAMDARLRKIKQRCKERGIPFVITDYVGAK